MQGYKFNYRIKTIALNLSSFWQKLRNMVFFCSCQNWRTFSFFKKILWFWYPINNITAMTEFPYLWPCVWHWYEASTKKLQKWCCCALYQNLRKVLLFQNILWFWCLINHMTAMTEFPYLRPGVWHWYEDSTINSKTWCCCALHQNLR